MNSMIEKLWITPGLINLLIVRSKIKAMSEREEMISRLVSIFPNDGDDIRANIRDIEIKTYGIKWCIDYALSGKSWSEIKEAI